MKSDRDVLLSRRSKFVAAALAATGMTLGVHPRGDEIPTAEAQPQPPPPPQPQICLSVAWNPLHEGEQALARGDYTRAIQALKNAIGRHGDARVHVLFGRAYEGAGDLV